MKQSKNKGGQQLITHTSHRQAPYQVHTQYTFAYAALQTPLLYVLPPPKWIKKKRKLW